MINTNQKVEVKNRSNSTAVYSLPELNIRRQFAPGETKQLTIGELEALTYRPGGLNLIKDCLLIQDTGIARQIINQKIEPEYWLDEKGIKELLEKGSLDEFLDCLDFAPGGVIELIKVVALKMPLNDVKKREAIRVKTGFDLDRALLNLRLAQEENNESSEKETTPERRVKKDESGRRATPNYKIVKQGE